MLNLLTVLDYVEVFMSPSVFGVAHVLADRSIEKLRLSFYFSGHRVYCKEKRLFGNRRCHRRTPSRFSHFLSLHYSLTNTQTVKIKGPSRQHIDHGDCISLIDLQGKNMSCQPAAVSDTLELTPMNVRYFLLVLNVRTHNEKGGISGQGK